MLRSESPVQFLFKVINLLNSYREFTLLGVFNCLYICAKYACFGIDLLKAALLLNALKITMHGDVV
jgi:hypothetical protein